MKTKISPEPTIRPEELMTIQVLEVHGVRRAAVHLTCWHLMRPNYEPWFICALKPLEAQRKKDLLREFDLEHIMRIRDWLVKNPAPDLSGWGRVDRLFPLKRHLWKAVLETHKSAEVELLCQKWGPLGDLNDDLELSPFRSGEINRHEIRDRLQA